jgi:microcystin degradation protein MlrC
MPRILVAQCMQEVSSFNPVKGDYGYFRVIRSNAMFDAFRGTQSYVAGALGVLETRSDIEPIPTYSADACSAGMLDGASFKRLAGEVLDAIRAEADRADALYFSLHGAMAAEGEPDPEGHLLEAARRILGPSKPIVISLDLHGILTARMLRNCDGVTMLHTYPHVDFVDTGARAARLLLRILEGGSRPVTARVRVPALVRGDELITETGFYGSIIRMAQAAERRPDVLAAGMMIGNPFTDVPELCCQAVVTTDGDAALAEREALALAAAFWPERARMQGRLIALPEAIAAAKATQGPVIFTDAADAPSSGATGDSNAILTALIAAGYRGRVLLPITDPPAVQRAREIGVGARGRIRLGGALDPRFAPVEIEADVDMLSRGRYVFESWGSIDDAGPCAVLQAGTITIVATSRPVNLFDRSLFLAHGQDPQRFDLVVVKSPHCQPRFFDAWAARNFNIDAPGSTGANLRSLGHRVVARPIYPLDEGVSFTPAVEIYRPRA